MGPICIRNQHRHWYSISVSYESNQKLDGHLQKQTWTTQKTVQMKTADFIQMIYLDIYVNN